MATVLTLEDDRLSQRLVEKVFRNAGHEVLLAETTSGGLDLLRNRMLIDLVILDSHLGADLGWRFLAEVRRRPFFRDIPVVVYTGHTEREDVLRYAELRVQAVHVKPIKADVLLTELEKAMAQGRMARLIQEPDEVCARLRIDRQEYAGLLNSAVAHLEEDRRVVNRKLTASNDPLLWAALERMKARLPELGVMLMKDLVNTTAEELRRGDLGAATEALGAIDTLCAIVRKRAVAMLGAGSSFCTTGHASERAAEVQTPLPPENTSEKADGMSRRMLARPLSAFGAYLTRVRAEPLAPEEIDAAIARMSTANGPIAPWLDAIALIDSVPQLDVDLAARALMGVEGFGPTCQRILLRSGLINRVGASEREIMTAAGRMGVAQTALMAAIAQLARARVASPLELTPLRHHASVVALLAFELGRLLKVSNAHRLAAAGLARNVGLWFIAMAEPGLTAIALASCAQSPIGDAIERLVGVSHHELARRVLAAKQQPELFQEVARVRLAADELPKPDHQVTVAIILVAETLARVIVADDSSELKQLREELAKPEYPAWAYLRARGVQLPLDLTEFLEVLVTLAASSSWIAREITG